MPAESVQNTEGYVLFYRCTMPYKDLTNTVLRKVLWSPLSNMYVCMYACISMVTPTSVRSVTVQTINIHFITRRGGSGGLEVGS